MADDLHAVVKLLLARMESHPDEFHKDHSEPLGGLDGRRWQRVIETIVMYGAEEEKQALKHAMRKVQLAKAHEDMMDELCNGEERRRKEEEEQEYERTMMQQVGAKKKIVMTHAEMDIINKLTETSTLAEKEQFIREYAKSKQEMRK